MLGVLLLAHLTAGVLPPEKKREVDRNRLYEYSINPQKELRLSDEKMYIFYGERQRRCCTGCIFFMVCSVSVIVKMCCLDPNTIPPAALLEQTRDNHSNPFVSACVLRKEDKLVQ